MRFGSLCLSRNFSISSVLLTHFQRVINHSFVFFRNLFLSIEPVLILSMSFLILITCFFSIFSWIVWLQVKKYIFVSLIFSVVFLFSTSLVFALIFIISSLLLTLSPIFSSQFLKMKLNSLIWDHYSSILIIKFPSVLLQQPPTNLMCVFMFIHFKILSNFPFDCSFEAWFI